MALYLHCVICSRKQADGLISGMAWGRVEAPNAAPTNGTSAGGTVRVCPTCMSSNDDWQSLALSGLRANA